ncbi:MAG: hypothetical protein JWR21_2884 [Herminiimonas sp.]|nr:hypothetical protein [Herminiimonas sp.]
MKISETTSYPHPVLAPWSADITGAKIDTNITFREGGEGNQVSIHCTTDLNQPDIHKLIREGLASFGLYIKCQETGLRRLQHFGFPSGVHHLAPGALLGRVQVRPMVWSIKRIVKYNPVGAHAEFGDGSDIEPGEILALDDEQVIDVTRPPIPSIESIFEIKASEGVKEGQFEVDMLSDRVTVRMAPNTYQLVQELRGTNDGTRIAIMNSLYVPVVMQVLSDLSNGQEQYEQYRWLHPFLARCQLASVEIESPDLLNDSQRLLALPFATLNQLIQSGEG